MDLLPPLDIKRLEVVLMTGRRCKRFGWEPLTPVIVLELLIKSFPDTDQKLLIAAQLKLPELVTRALSEGTGPYMQALDATTVRLLHLHRIELFSWILDQLNDWYLQIMLIQNGLYRSVSDRDLYWVDWLLDRMSKFPNHVDQILRPSLYLVHRVNLGTVGQLIRDWAEYYQVIIDW